MFLQILPPDTVTTSESFLDNQLVLVVVGLAVAVFAIIKAAKFLNTIKLSKSIDKPSYTS